jgi:hypothetical protein
LDELVKPKLNMKINIIALIALLISTSIFAQTTIETLQEGTFMQLGVEANSRIAFAGQALGVNGPEFLLAFSYYNKNGIYASIGPTFYTDKKVVKKSAIAEINYTLGYAFGGEKFTSDNSLSHSQVLYGNKFFKAYLANVLTSENNYQFSDDFEISANVMVLFGAKLKRNNASVLEGNAQYHFYWQDALGAEQITITPSLSYFYGSDKIIASFAQRDSLSEKTKLVDVANTMHTLSIYPSISANWQKNVHEIELELAVPYAKTETTLPANPLNYSYDLKINRPIFSLRYNYYIGFGGND